MILYLSKVFAIKLKTIMNKLGQWDNRNSGELFGAILELENVAEARRFFRDLLTEQEIIEFSNRWRAARMLSENKSYKDIIMQTGLSSRTVARISKWLENGTNGYKLIIKRMNNHHNPSSLEKGLS